MGEARCLCILTIASCHRQSTLASQTCEGLQQLWALPQHLFFFLTCNLRDTIPCQRSPTLMPCDLQDTIPCQRSSTLMPCDLRDTMPCQRSPTLMPCDLQDTIPRQTSPTLIPCDLRDTMPCQRSPTLIPGEVEDFPRGGHHSKHVPLLTYLAWLQPIYYNSWLVFIKTAKILLVVKTFIKNIKQQPH